MSLLNRGSEVVTVFPEEAFTDGDGNASVRASSVGVVVKASVQPLSSEEGDEGFLTETKYRLRLVGYPAVLGSRSQVVWRGKRFSLLGDGLIRNSSRWTSHVTYTMVRA